MCSCSCPRFSSSGSRSCFCCGAALRFTMPSSRSIERAGKPNEHSRVPERSRRLMRHETVDIRTEDGTCPTHVLEPDGKGAWPGVVLFMDGHGVRPALLEIGERLAGGG